MFGLGGMDFGNTIPGNFLGVSSEADKDQADYSKTSAKIAEDYWKRTKGVRNPVIDALAKFMQGGMDPTASAMYAPGKLAVEQQYGSAMDNMMANLPSGGALNEGIATMETGRAGSLVELINQIIQDEYNKAFSMATNSPQQLQQGLGVAGGINSALLGKQGQTLGAQYGAIGSIGGGAMGAM